MWRTSVKYALTPVLCVLVSCSNLLFWPDNITYYTPDQFAVPYSDIYATTADGITLHGYRIDPLPPNSAKNIGVVFFHGNAQNNSTHFINTLWLAREGFTVYAFDYRGYGKSEGTAAFPEVFMDLRAAYDYTAQFEEHIIIFGQSLGAALSVFFVAENPDISESLSGMILDAPFSDYEGIARDILSTLWLTWPFQYPLSLTMPGDRYDPITVIDRIQKPVLLFHSRDDAVVPFYHSERLVRRNPSIQFVPTTGSHISTFRHADNIDIALTFMRERNAADAAPNP